MISFVCKWILRLNAWWLIPLYNWAKPSKDQVISIGRQMQNDLPNRKNEVDLATVYGYYLGKFQTYRNYGTISDKEYDEIVEDELIPLYMQCCQKFKD